MPKHIFTACNSNNFPFHFPDHQLQLRFLQKTNGCDLQQKQPKYEEHVQDHPSSENASWNENDVNGMSID